MHRKCLGMASDMPNRRQRRAEVKRIREARRDEVVARNIRDRREARAHAHENTRMRARHRFDIPDDPTMFERTVEMMMSLYRPLVAISKQHRSLSIIVQVLVWVAAVFFTKWYRQYFTIVSTASSISSSDIDNTSLALAAWEPMSLDG
jgi:hypothetical protein